MENTQYIEAQSNLIFWSTRLLLTQADTQDAVRADHIALMSALGALEGTLPNGICSGVIRAVSEQLGIKSDDGQKAFDDLLNWGYFKEIDMAAQALRDLEDADSEVAEAIKVLLKSENAQVESSHKHYELVFNHDMVKKLHMSGE
ncbi:hypothetical protein [Weissella tructae]